MIILVDLDNTLADFDAAFLSSWKEKYPDEVFIPLEQSLPSHTDFIQQSDKNITVTY